MVLLTLWTFASAFAQIAASEAVAPESAPSDSNTNVPSSISTVSECSAGANDAVSGVEVSPQVFSCLNPRDEAQFAGRFVNERLAVWQHRLNLEDWHISVAMARRSDLKPKTLGGIRWDKNKKSAVMGILDPCDYRLPFREMLDDMEFTIVHELVHLELASLPRSEASRSSEEHAVNQIAEALLRLDRPARGTKGESTIDLATGNTSHH
jgi:hypothetical protein